MKTVAGVLEIIRLAWWNFFSIEYQHIKLFKKFSVKTLLSLPFNINLDISKNKRDYNLVKIILMKELREKRIFEDLLIQSNTDNMNNMIFKYKRRQLTSASPSVMEESQWEILSRHVYI